MSSSSAFVVGSYLLARDQNLDDKMEECGLLPFGKLTVGGGVVPRSDSVLGRWKHATESEKRTGGEAPQEVSLSFYNYLSDSEVDHLEDLYSYLGCCENGQPLTLPNGHVLVGAEKGGVGTFGGSEDHAAILGSIKGHLSHFGFCPTKCQKVFPWDAELSMVIASSGVEAEKTTAKLEDYNNAVLLARAAQKTITAFVRQHTLEGERAGDRLETLSLWRLSNLMMEIMSREPGKHTFEMSTVFDSSSAKFERHRFEQLLEEMELIQGFLHCYAKRDYPQLKQVVQRSQHLTEKLLQNTVPETRFLPASAIEEGAVAASVFGAGFGGSVYALVEADKAHTFASAWKQKYAKAFPENSSNAQFMVMNNVPGGAIQFLRVSTQ
jgi:galactokinase